MAVFALVHLALRNNLSKMDDDDLPTEVSRLERFLVELLLAARRKRNLIYFVDCQTLRPFRHYCLQIY